MNTAFHTDKSVRFGKRGIAGALAALMMGGVLLTGGAAYADDHDHDHHDRDHHDVVRHEEARHDENRHDQIRHDQIQHDRNINIDRHIEAHDISKDIDHRQNTKNTWRNVALASGAVAALGLLKHDNTITFIGAAGALYSAERYEQDRKSQGQEAQARAALFDRGSFDRGGVHYTKHETIRDGKKYYYFGR